MLCWSKALPETPPNLIPLLAHQPTPNHHTHPHGARKTAQPAADEGDRGASRGGSWGRDDPQGRKRKEENNKRGSNPSELLWLNGSLWSCYTLCHPDPPPSPAAGNYDGQAEREEGWEGQREGGREDGWREFVCVSFNWCTGCCVEISSLGFQG